MLTCFELFHKIMLYNTHYGIFGMLSLYFFYHTSTVNYGDWIHIIRLAMQNSFCIYYIIVFIFRMDRMIDYLQLVMFVRSKYISESAPQCLSKTLLKWVTDYYKAQSPTISEIWCIKIMKYQIIIQYELLQIDVTCLNQMLRWNQQRWQNIGKFTHNWWYRHNKINHNIPC